MSFRKWIYCSIALYEIVYYVIFFNNAREELLCLLIIRLLNAFFLAIRITSCGATGRKGPTIEKCAEEHNSSDVELVVAPSISEQESKLPIFSSNGVQRWTAPRGEYYTLVDISKDTKL